MKLRGCVLTATSLILGWLVPCETRAEETAELASVVDPRAGGLAEALQADEEAVQPEAETESVRASDKPLGEGPRAEVVAGGRDQAAISDVANSVAPEVFSLPGGSDKTGVSANAISVPHGSGTIRGMEESFSAELSTGIASYSFPFALPEARGKATPTLGLQYSSASGAGVAGLGWSLSVPFIARQTDKGPPKYIEVEGGFVDEQDRFVFNGGQELVPICVVRAQGACPGALAGEVMPVWAEGWQYFRPRVEGGFQRFFWSPNHETWRVQDKGGGTLELGVPLDGSDYVGALEQNPDRVSEIYRWYLVRKYDTYGAANPASGNPAPVNVAVYRYLRDRGAAYLSDVFDTPPAANPTTSDLGKFAHHTRLVYEPRSDPTYSYRPGFRIDQGLRLRRVEVASKTFGGGPDGVRRRVRQYHLGYEPGFRTSHLATVEIEGRCAGDEAQAPSEATAPYIEDPMQVPTQAACTGAGSNPNCSCPRLPAVRFGYSHVTPAAERSCSIPSGLDGFEGFDGRVREIAESPPHSADEDHVDFFDFNADALPDVVVTAPGVYGRDHGLFCNGAGGSADAFGAATPLGIAAVLGATSSNITFRNPNLAPLDHDGDGVVDLLHMPATRTYSIYAPSGGCTAPRWVGREVRTASGQNPKIDFGRDAAQTRIVDVDFDGLLDVIVSTGTEFQTFFSLGRYHGGDGQFGSARVTGPASADIDNDPVRTCVPSAGEPVRFSDADTRFADMNGDGIADIVRLRRGDIRYWPGRGNGVFGAGLRDDCPAGTFGNDRHVSMITSPNYSDIQGTTLLIDDVNGDGLADLVQNRFDAVDIWLNEGGLGWTDRHILCGTPASPSFANRVRLLDVNGSGTADIVWANADRYQYVDLQGGERPGLLVHIENGLGRSTDIEYSTSTAEMLDAERGAACNPSSPPVDPFSAAWCSKMPIVAHVVKRVTDNDNVDAFGRRPNVHVLEHTYRDPVYDGVQREFRGFRHVRTRNVGDANSPTDITHTTFLLGECVSEESGDCSAAGNNPREALKGLAVVTERHDEAGTYLSTGIVTYRLRQLYRGLDGALVRHAFTSSQRDLLYDTDATPFPADPPGQATAGVELEGTPGSVTSVLSLSAPKRSTSGHAEIVSTTSLDSFGNSIESVAQGCVSGAACATGAQGALAEPARDEIITTRNVAGRPNGDPTGWLFRSVESYVTGNAHLDSSGAPERLRNTLNTYNTQGDLIEVRAVLRGSLPLFRFHQPGEGGVIRTDLAPAPPEASVDGTLLISTAQYDQFGNVTRETGPNGRCRDVGYEGSNTRPPGTPASGYDQFPTSETSYTGGCGIGALTSSASVDRGFGVVTLVTDRTDQQTLTRYDGFGRVVSQTKPDPAGVLSPQALPASVIIDYFLPSDLSATTYSAVRTRIQDGSGPSVQSYLEAWTFVDGLGRPLATLSEAEQSGTWVVSERVDYDVKFAASRKYQPHFHAGTPQEFARSPRASVPYVSQIYDAFGRQLATFDIDGTMTMLSLYHALSAEHLDAADLDNGPHQGTPARQQSDGHNRSVVTSGSIHVGSSVEEHRTVTRYRPTGEPEVITRVRFGKPDAPVTRFMRFDTLGRMVLNVEPNTSLDFAPNPARPADGLKAWRYAYNNAGDLVGTSDARGCGVNYAYDRAGRVVSEDYSPCEPSHPTYSAPTSGGAGGPEGLEVLHVYDQVPLFTGLEPPAEVTAQNPRFLRGLPAATFDRGSASFPVYDGRGRFVRNAVRVTRPDSLSALLRDRYAPRWYQKVLTHDAADRETVGTTGAGAPELLGQNAASAVTTEYTARGTVARVGGSYGELVRSIQRDADGQVLEIVRGDVASTTTSFAYDERRRVRSIQTYRSRPPIWSSPPSNYQPPPPSGLAPTTLQLLLQDQDITYDVVNNPVEIRDYRTPEEWPDGAKPVTRKMRYDDYYRLIRVEHEYTGGSDDWVSPFAAENGTDNAFDDARRADASPHVAFDGRVFHQTFQYEWLGNTTRSSDDAGGFYDRSLGTIENGTANAGPYQLKSASSSGTRGGSLAALYDASGNLTRLDVRRMGPCLPQNALCSQRFAYDWDEVGRLVRGRRWDLPAASVGTPSAPLPQTTPAADLRHVYDGGDERVLKSATDGNGVRRHTAYVFDSLELRGATYANGDFERTSSTEVAYLSANGVRLARLAYEKPAAPSIGGTRLHVFLELGDHLGSTNVVLDTATSELVESTTYQAYGTTDSDYRPDRWQAFREDYRFTGKEEDVEVGLAYFGKRFYAPALGRWISPDPLAVHSPGAGDSNLYAYVAGRTLQTYDADGLQAADEKAFLQDVARSGSKAAGIPASSEAPKVPGYNSGMLGASGRAPTGVTHGDHIISLDSLSADPKYQGLTYEQQLKVANQPKNLAQLDAGVNMSKGAEAADDYLARRGVAKGEAVGVAQEARLSTRRMTDEFAAANAKNPNFNRDVENMKFLNKNFNSESARALFTRIRSTLPRGLRQAAGNWITVRAGGLIRSPPIRTLGRIGAYLTIVLSIVNVGKDIHDWDEAGKAIHLDPSLGRDWNLIDGSYTYQKYF